MKYWTLFTLRMIVPAVLLTVVLSWWATQSAIWQLTANYRSRGVMLTTFQGHWSFAVVYSSDDSLILYGEADEVADANEMSSRLDTVWPVSTQVAPGLQYRTYRGNHGHMIRCDYWLACLALLLATLGIFRKRKHVDTPPAEPNAVTKP